MIIKSLELGNYRNYEKLSLDFDQGTNILYGNNGQGKTNILESVYLCATTKSHRGSKDKELVRFGMDNAHIRSIIEKNSRENQIDIHIKTGSSKGIAINRAPVKKAGELFGLLNVVLFSPEDLSIIKNGPQFRRRFMDMELCQTDSIYLHNLTMYRKAVDQRNSLLKDLSFGRGDMVMLDVWDEKVVEYGMNVIFSRQRFINSINPIVSDIHREITGSDEVLDISYDKNVEAESFSGEIKKNRERDIHFGQTHIGPHKDDISIELNGVDMRKYGSQGQQRTCALSMKLSEIEMIRLMTGDTPVLLLDDVLSELDSDRQELLLKHIRDTQTIMTCTGMDSFIRNNFDINRVYKVNNGTIE